MDSTQYEYAQWIDILLTRLQISRTNLVQGQLEPDWLMVPAPGQELTAEEVSALFTAVSAWLLAEFDPLHVVRSIQQRLGTLHGVEMLPLLFAMRQVAYEYGESRRYWPDFHQHLLGGRGNLSDVRLLGRDFAELWRSFHRTSRYTLFYPQEGPANIKWPLTHAGLLAQDIPWLLQYGSYLKQGEPDDMSPVLTEDIGEFQSELLDWLYRTGEEQGGLARRLGNAYFGVTTALLARRELQQRWTSIQASQSPAIERSRIKPIRPRLRYNTATEDLELVLPEGAWEGFVRNVRVRFGNTQCSWPPSYDGGRNLSFAKNCVISIRSPVWPESITVAPDAEERSYPVRSSPFAEGNGGMLFDAETGWRASSCRPDEAYYLLVPQKSVDADWVEALFSEVLHYGKPNGDWDGYTLLWVRSRNLLDGATSELQANQVEELLSVLDDAGVALSLPTLRDSLRPRIRPVFGLPAYLPDGQEKAFLVTDPPDFEVRGLSSCTLPCTLTRWDPQTRQHVVDRSLMLPQLTGGPLLVVPFEEPHPEPGHYQLQVGDESLPFRLVQPPVCAAQTCALEMVYLTEDGPEEGYLRPLALLTDAVFGVQAWPGAALTLHIADTGREQTFPILADESGVCRFNPNDFVRNLQKARAISCFVTWGPIHTATYRFFNNVEAEVKMHWSGETLYLDGKVFGREAVTEASVLILGTHPWRSEQVQSITVPVQDGEFRVAITAEKATSRWLIIRSPNSATVLHPGPPWLIKRLTPDLTTWPNKWPLGLLDGWDTWSPIAEWLVQTSIPMRDLREAVFFSQLARFAQLRAGNRGGFLPAVRPISPALQADIIPLLYGDAPPTVTLMPPGTLPPVGENERADAVIHGLPLNESEAFAVLNGQVPTEGLQVKVFDDNGGYVVAMLRPEGESFTLTSDVPLTFCNECKRYLPGGAQQNHKCRSFRPIMPGRVDRVVPAVVWDPDTIGRAIVGLLRGGLDETLLSDSFIEWLNQMAAIQERLAPGYDPITWLQQVSDLAALTIQVIARPVLPTENRQLCSQAAMLTRHREAVDLMLQQFSHWTA